MFLLHCLLALFIPVVTQTDELPHLKFGPDTFLCRSNTVVVSYPRFNCRHTTSASTSSQWSLQMVPHLPLWYTSTRPSKTSRPPTNLKGMLVPEKTRDSNKSADNVHITHLTLDLCSTGNDCISEQTDFNN